MSIPLTPVESSQIHAIGHDAPTRTLAVQFNKGNDRAPGPVYHYANVTPEKHAALLASESKAKHFAEHIKAPKNAFGELVHPFEKQDKK